MTSLTYFSVMNDKGMVLVAILLLLFTQFAYTQDEDSLTVYEHNVMETRWLMFDMGLNQFVFNDAAVDYTPFELKTSKSFQFDLHVFRQRVSLYRNQYNIEYGFTLDFNRYELANPYVLQPGTDFVIITDDTTGYKRNSINTSSMVLPLQFQYESNPRNRAKSFHVAVGAHVGVVLGFKNKLKSNAGDKSSVKSNFNINQLKYGLQAEIGYSYFTVYYKYGLSPFFAGTRDGGYEMSTMSFGIRLIPFL